MLGEMEALSNAIAREERILLGILPGVGIGLFGAIVALVFAARRVSRPIEDLARQADRVAAGDYDLPPPSPRRDEFGTLGKAMHDMAAAISEREERIRYNATHDPITDLPNRRSLIAAIEDNAKGPAAMLAVIAPRWRETTNTVGRDIGERAMRAWADRIKSRAPTDAVVAAIGEASFGLFLPEASESEALSVGRNLIAALSVPYEEEGLAIDAGVAIGVEIGRAHV